MIALDPTHFLGHWALGMGLDGIGASAEARRRAGASARVVRRDAVHARLSGLRLRAGRDGRDDARALLDGGAGPRPGATCPRPRSRWATSVSASGTPPSNGWTGPSRFAIRSIMPIKTYSVPGSRSRRCPLPRSAAQDEPLHGDEPVLLLRHPTFRAHLAEDATIRHCVPATIARLQRRSPAPRCGSVAAGRGRGGRDGATGGERRREERAERQQTGSPPWNAKAGKHASSPSSTWASERSAMPEAVRARAGDRAAALESKSTPEVSSPRAASTGSPRRWVARRGVGADARQRVIGDVGPADGVAGAQDVQGYERAS